MELRHLRAFVEVARRGSFTRAAEVLHVAQPSLSLQLKRLQEELGVALLDPGVRRVRLTPAGEAFLSRAERLLADAEAATCEVREFGRGDRGRVTVGTTRISGSYVLPPVILAFRRRHPQVELVLREENTATLIALSRRGEVDVSLITAGPEVPDLEVLPLITEPLLLAVPPGHPLAQAPTVALSQAAPEPFVLLKEGMGFRQVALQACAAAGFVPHVVFQSSDLDTLQALVAAGMGVTLVPRMAAEGVRAPSPAFVPLSPPVPTRTLSLAWRRDRLRSAAARAFVALAVELWRPTA